MVDVLKILAVVSGRGMSFVVTVSQERLHDGCLPSQESTQPRRIPVPTVIKSSDFAVVRDSRFYLTNLQTQKPVPIAPKQMQILASLMECVPTSLPGSSSHQLF
jgi:hypothetical protein